MDVPRRIGTRLWADAAPSPFSEVLVELTQKQQENTEEIRLKDCVLIRHIELEKMPTEENIEKEIQIIAKTKN